jgi:hypothetical protein
MKRQVVIFLVLGLGLAVLLGVVFRQLFINLVMEPLLNQFVPISRFLQRLDPNSVWLLFIMLCGCLVLITLPSSGPPSSAPGQDDTTIQGGRVDYWRKELHNLYNQSVWTRYSVAEVRMLTLNVVAYRRGLSLQEAEGLLRSPNPDIPVEVRALFHSESPDTDDDRPASRSWFSRPERLVNVASGRSYAPRIGKIIKFLEEELGITHDTDHLSSS